MDRYNKLIFVSTGGTCRSILAKAIYNNIPGDNKLEAGARGFVVLFNEPVNPKAVAIAKSKGIEIGDPGQKTHQKTQAEYGSGIRPRYTASQKQRTHQRRTDIIQSLDEIEIPAARRTFADDHADPDPADAGRDHQQKTA